jgi:phage/plasmid-associated DNA primase
MSKFVNPEDPVINDTPYQFPKDPLLKEKLPKWAPVFASMLVKRAFENQGVVKNCDIVMSASNKYRQGQDHIAGFVSEMIVQKQGGKISKQEMAQQFKQWFIDSQGSKKQPKGTELTEYINKKFPGCNTKEGWKNIAMIYEGCDEDEVDQMY